MYRMSNTIKRFLLTRQQKQQFQLQVFHINTLFKGCLARLCENFQNKKIGVAGFQSDFWLHFYKFCLFLFHSRMQLIAF